MPTHNSALHIVKGAPIVAAKAASPALSSVVFTVWLTCMQLPRDPDAMSRADWKSMGSKSAGWVPLDRPTSPSTAST